MIAHSRPWIVEADVVAVTEALRSGDLAGGIANRHFEGEVAAFVGAADAVLCASGTAALATALASLALPPDSEVICPSYVCHNVVDAIRAVGARPVLCDLAKGAWCASAATVKAVITARTHAVVAVHTFGLPADVEGIRALGFPVVEDAAQAFGCTVGGKRLGALGDVGIFSFHATKMLATGEGGAVVVRDRERFDAIIAAGARNAVAAPFPTLSAALGRSQLHRFDAFAERRRLIAERYFEELPPDLTGALRAIPRASLLFRFPLRWQGHAFDAIQAAFAVRGVSVRRGVDQLNHRIAGLGDDGFTESVNRFESTVSIPLYPALTDGEISDVIAAVRAVADELVPC